MRVLEDVRSLEKKIISELSIEEAFKHVEWLYENVPERLAGTPEERKTVEYIVKTLESYGISVEVFEFDAYVGLPKKAEAKILTPRERIIRCVPFAFSAPSPPEGVQAEVVYVQGGDEENYKDIDVKGKLVLAELSFHPPRPQKTKIAERHGATGILISGPSGDIISKGTVKSVWGNPAPDQVGEFPKIPAISISKADAEYIKDLCQRQKTIVWIKVDATCEWRKVLLPLATITGKKTQRFILVAAHHDAWGKGVTCNAVGIALLIELARVFWKYRDHLNRTLKFAWWPAHETGIYAGSTWFNDEFWEDMQNNAIAVYNCDSPGIKGGKYSAWNTEEIEDFHLNTASEILGREVFNQRAFKKIADMSFINAGIPYLWGDPTGGSLSFGSWYHSDEDTLDKVDKKFFFDCLKVYSAVVLRLCNMPLLPFNLLKTTNTIIDELEKMEKLKLLDLSYLISRTKFLRDEIAKLNEYGEKALNRQSETEISMINDCLIKLCRVLIPINYNATGDRYRQDDMGTTYKPVKVLQLIYELPNLNQESSEFKAIRTKLIRERNRILDAINEALFVVKETLQKLN